MILPIYTYGQPVLKRVADDITMDYADLADLVANMWETMYNAKGVGLAAPQVGRSIRLFMIDTEQLEGDDDEPDFKGIKRVFINAHIVEETGDRWEYEEGCLSIPNIRGDVARNEHIRLRYMDKDFKEHEEEFTGINARVIQHEYDHIDGVLFTEKLKPLRKRRVKRKLDNMAKGIVDADYAIRPARG